MPIGSAKIGVLGAGLVPGGTQTFNASGTFSVPPGVKKVNITGKGATGNPGNAGNPGNSGSFGFGGAGGAAGNARMQGNPPIPTGPSGIGGSAFKGVQITNCGFFVPNPVFVQINCTNNSWYNKGVPAPYAPKISLGGGPHILCPSNVNQNGSGALQPNGQANQAAQAGGSGAAGNAGTAGNPGNPGNVSSTLCKTFPGGAGGNAGVAGAAGTGGSGGTAGGNGGDFYQRSGGSAGNGAGSGGCGKSRSGPFPSGSVTTGGGGGGGAGVTNDGSPGRQGDIFPAGPAVGNNTRARGGTYPCIQAPVNCGISKCSAFPAPPANVNTCATGGCGGSTSRGSIAIALGNQGGEFQANCRPLSRQSINPFNPAPLRPNVYRSGGGGGGDFRCYGGVCITLLQSGGGGGGGGRGQLGGAGGNSSAPSGSAANPTTFNCVAVTPGGSVPVTVASPGGQIVISWNPQ